MAINIVEYNMIRVLRRLGLLPLGGDLLELGETNWSGDIDLDTFRRDIAEFAAADRRQSLRDSLDQAVGAARPEAIWELAKIYWHTFLQPASMTAIDFHGTEGAIKLDLNGPIDLKRQFHFIMNSGTLEHIFNIGQAFKTIHDHMTPGGVVLHGFPFTGWIDHGFFNINPTVIWDLAAINSYQICLLTYCELDPPKVVRITSREQILQMAANGEIGRNAMLYVLLRKPAEHQQFRIPMQGIYAGNISADAKDAWYKLR
jgi:hypothetical protein